MKEIPVPTSYGEATERLETLLEQIDRDNQDLDELIEQVEEATALIRYCRKKITASELRVKEILQQLDDDTDEA